MSRLVYLLFSLPLLLSFITSAHAGPACARRNQGTDSCIEACKQKWGWPGFVMGTDPWGSVMTVTKTNDMGAVITQACRARSYVVLTYSLPCLSNSLSLCPVSQVCSWCFGLCYTYRIQHKYPLVYADSARHLDYRFPFPRPRQCDSICIRVYCHICSRFGRTFCILGAFRLEQHLIQHRPPQHYQDFHPEGIFYHLEEAYCVRDLVHLHQTPYYLYLSEDHEHSQDYQHSTPGATHHAGEAHHTGEAYHHAGNHASEAHDYEAGHLDAVQRQLRLQQRFYLSERY